MGEVPSPKSKSGCGEWGDPTNEHYMVPALEGVVVDGPLIVHVLQYRQWKLEAPASNKSWMLLSTIAGADYVRGHRSLPNITERFLVNKDWRRLKCSRRHTSSDEKTALVFCFLSERKEGVK